jgi:hypothetical protein
MDYLYNIQRMEENMPRFYRIGVVKSKPKIVNRPDYEIRDKVLDWLENDMEVRVSDKIKVTSEETIIVQPYSKDEVGFRSIGEKIFKDEVEIPDVIVQTQYNSENQEEDY